MVISPAVPFRPIQARMRAGPHQQTELPGTGENRLTSSTGTAIAKVAN